MKMYLLSAIQYVNEFGSWLEHIWRNVAFTNESSAVNGCQICSNKETNSSTSDGLRVSKLSANLYFWVNYSFKLSGHSIMFTLSQAECVWGAGDVYAGGEAALRSGVYTYGEGVEAGLLFSALVHGLREEVRHSNNNCWLCFPVETIGP